MSTLPSHLYTSTLDTYKFIFVICCVLQEIENMPNFLVRNVVNKLVYFAVIGLSSIVSCIGIAFLILGGSEHGASRCAE